MPEPATTTAAPCESSGEWPYDAAPGHRWTAAYRLPVLGTIYPQWRYHVALVVAPDGLWPAVEPTEEEAAQLASYLEYWLSRFYRPSYIEQMRQRPFDIDGGTVTRTFLKRPDGTWCWRQCTWTMGPVLAPARDEPKQYRSLVDLLDQRVETLMREEWAEWKADRPDIFRGTTATNPVCSQ